jgi:tRNA pseudouridine13 synthase
VPAPPLPPESERALGLEFYASPTPGTGGKIKRTPDDFRVNELSLYPMPDPQGAFTVLRVESRDWEQHELAQAIAGRLRLAPGAMRFAGTKDRRSVAERLFSYRGAPPSEPVDIPRTSILDAYRARDGLVLGHHFGNRFDVAVHLSGGTGEALSRIRDTSEALRGFGGFPNFFGPQRFGEVRPVTHAVGRWLVRGDVARAVEEYLGAPGADPHALGEAARSEYRRSGDVGAALRTFPPAFRFERAILDQLSRGKSPGRALSALSRPLRTLFVHAFQSLLFNRYLSHRWRAGTPFGSAIVGDTLLRVTRDGTIPGTSPVPVRSDNLKECEELVARGGARVAGPLPGYATPLGEGAPADWLSQVLREEDVSLEMFRLPEAPELASAGSYRPIVVPLPVVGAGRAGESGAPDALRLRFALPKGAYATVLLREFMKSGAPAAS